MSKKYVDCPVCNIKEEAESLDNNNLDIASFDCPRCGKFEGENRVIFPMTSMDPNGQLSAWIREHKEYGKECPQINTYIMENIIENLPIVSTARKQLLLLKYIESKTEYPGAVVDIDPKYDFPVAWAKGEKELQYLIGALNDRKYINLKENDTDLNYKVSISPDGWDYLDKHDLEPILTDQVFVAMSFSSKLKDVYSNGIKEAIEQAGYKSYRVDMEPHSDKIDSKIITEIKNSRFLVADVTEQRQGVYFEAGFALGINRPVLWCVREDELDEVHFDTRQYNHIVWTDVNDLRDQLYYFISALIGTNKNKA